MEPKWIFLVNVDESVKDSFMEYFTDMASFGGASFNRKESVYEGIVYFKSVVLGLAPYFNYINKVLILEPGSKSKINRFITFVKFLSESVLTAPLSADIYFVSSQKGISKYLQIAHVMTKKSGIIFPEEDYRRIKSAKNRLPGVMDVGDDDSAARVALALVALASGVHRHGVALRQVAAQEAAEAILEGRSEFVGLLATLYVDVYLWYIYEAARKKPAVGKELLHSIFSKEILDAGKRLLNRFNGEELVCMYRGAVAALKDRIEGAANRAARRQEELERMRSFIEEVGAAVVDVINNVTSNVANLSSGREVVLGRVQSVIKNFNKRQDDARCMVLSLTEQTSPAFAGMLWRALREPECVKIIYTPQTLYNRLLFEYLSPFKRRNGLEAKVEFIPVPGLEPRVTREVIRGLAEELRAEGSDGRVVVLAQGPMAVFLPLMELAASTGGVFVNL